MPSISLANGGKYNCQLCGYQALQKSHLKLHEKSVHDGRKLQCPEYQAKEEGSLNKHQKAVDLGRKFKYPECEYQATWKYNQSSRISTYGPETPMSRMLIPGNSAK